MESITEHLLNRFGEVLGLNMAASRLAVIGGQVRFLSRYFLDAPHVQELVHGANIYAGFLNTGPEFIESVQKKGASQAIFTVQFTHDALAYTFPVESAELFEQFVRMLVFDAYVGNNDRHFYNWGIIRNISTKERPRFSPIYDTARGLFWNQHEDQLVQRLGRKGDLAGYIQRYCEDSKPRVGCDGKSGQLNHFELVVELKRIMPTAMLDEMRAWLGPDLAGQMEVVVLQEFKGLISPVRAELILRCLAYRQERMAAILE